MKLSKDQKICMSHTSREPISRHVWTIFLQLNNSNRKSTPGFITYQCAFGMIALVHARVRCSFSTSEHHQSPKAITCSTGRTNQNVRTTTTTKGQTTTTNTKKYTWTHPSIDKPCTILSPYLTSNFKQTPTNMTSKPLFNRSRRTNNTTPQKCVAKQLRYQALPKNKEQKRRIKNKE
jgi:hypothetical protein